MQTHIDLIRLLMEDAGYHVEVKRSLEGAFCASARDDHGHVWQVEGTSELQALTELARLIEFGRPAPIMLYESRWSPQDVGQRQPCRPPTTVR